MQTQQIKASQLCLFVSFASRLTRLAYKPEKIGWNYFWSSIFISKKYYWNTSRNTGTPWFLRFDFRNFQFTSVYNSILLSSPLVRSKQPWSTWFLLPRIFFVSPQRNSVLENVSNLPWNLAADLRWFGSLLCSRLVISILTQLLGGAPT